MNERKKKKTYGVLRRLRTEKKGSESGFTLQMKLVVNVVNLIILKKNND